CSSRLGGRSERREIVGRAGDIKQALDRDWRACPSLPACRTSIPTISSQRLGEKTRKNQMFGACDNGRLGRNIMRSAIGILALSALGSTILAGSAFADTSAKKIAFSNNYAGNSWRQAMLKSYDIVTKKAVADKVVGAADVFTTARQALTNHE